MFIEGAFILIFGQSELRFNCNQIFHWSIFNVHPNKLKITDFLTFAHSVKNSLSRVGHVI